MKVRFGRDGTIYAIFPGFLHTDGIVASVILKAGQTYPTNVHMPDWGKVTGHAVKYSHHPDGRAHFSQTGRVRTEVKKQSCALEAQRGHLFTVQVQDISAFKAPRRSSSEELTLRIPDELNGLKIVFWRYPMSLLQPANSSGWKGTPQGIQLSDGSMKRGLFVASPEGSVFDDYTLVVTPEEWKNKETDPCLIFIGGFDAADTSLNHSKDTSFLAFLYPCSDHNELRKKLGTIDLG